MSDTIIAAGIASIVVSIIYVFSSISNKNSSRLSLAQKASDSYNLMVTYRFKYPEVLRFSKLWEEENWAKIYLQKEKEDISWVHYYSYTELCLDYCNSILIARNEKIFDKKRFKNHHEKLLKLIITEHYPIIKSMVNAEKFISPMIGEFIQEYEKKYGWNWEEEHRKL